MNLQVAQVHNNNEVYTLQTKKLAEGKNTFTNKNKNELIS